MTRSCWYCAKGPEGGEMRPYGPGMTWAHLDCCTAAPATQTVTEWEYTQQMVACCPGYRYAGVQGYSIVDGEYGPVPPEGSTMWN